MKKLLRRIIKWWRGLPPVEAKRIRHEAQSMRFALAASNADRITLQNLVEELQDTCTHRARHIIMLKTRLESLRKTHTALLAAHYELKEQHNG